MCNQQERKITPFPASLRLRAGVPVLLALLPTTKGGRSWTKSSNEASHSQLQQQPPRNRRSPQRRRGRRRRRKEAGGKLLVTAALPPPVLQLYGGGRSRACPGDSGGPAHSRRSAGGASPRRYPVRPCAGCGLRGLWRGGLERLQKFPGGGGRYGGGGGGSSSSVSPLRPLPASLPSRLAPLTPLCFLGRFSDGDVDRDPGAAAQVRAGPDQARPGQAGGGWEAVVGSYPAGV